MRAQFDLMRAQGRMKAQKLMRARFDLMRAQEVMKVQELTKAQDHMRAQVVTIAQDLCMIALKSMRV